MRTFSVITLAFVSSTLLVGCSMFTAWKSIPPPGGCDQCHSVEIATNWRVTYQAARLTDERGHEYFQTAAGSFPPAANRPRLLTCRKGKTSPVLTVTKRLPLPINNVAGATITIERIPC